MVECPRCGSEVDELHFLPPEVMTRELLEALDDVDTDARETCSGCVRTLMET